MIPSSFKKECQQYLKDMVKSGAAPGFQLVLGWKDQTLGIFSAGVEDFRHRRPVRRQTWFDLASLTKMLVVVDLMAEALQTHKIASLELPLRTWFPFLSSDLKNRSLVELLNHRAGLKPVFNDIESIEAHGLRREDLIRFFWKRVDETYAGLTGETVYSDIDFQILGLVLEHVYGKNLGSLYQRDQLAYGPRKSQFETLRYIFNAPTVASIQSLDSEPRWLHGEAQDPRARWWGGDAGHAGLFGTAEGIDHWAREIYLSYHGKGLRLSDRVVRSICDFSKKEKNFLNGFDTPSEKSQAGDRFPPTTIGHLGYTGTSFWMDLETGARVTLLCHRFQPGIDPDRLRALRPGFHNWLSDSLFFKRGQ